MSEGNLKGSFPYLCDLTSSKSSCPIDNSLRICLRQFTPELLHPHQKPALHSFVSCALHRGRDTRFFTHLFPFFFLTSFVICFSCYHLLLGEILSNDLCESFFIPFTRLWIYNLQILVGVKRHSEKVLVNWGAGRGQAVAMAFSISETRILRNQISSVFCYPKIKWVKTKTVLLYVFM